jgi:hypothetical protein
MRRWRETLLDTLLAALVLLSIVLSAEVWFPSEPVRSGSTTEPRVQVSPPAQEGVMPDVFRAERIYVRRKDGRIALLQAGSVAYKRLWRQVQDFLVGVDTMPAPAPAETAKSGPEESITLVMPVSRTLEEWAEYWKWDAVGLRNLSLKVDRMTIQLGPTPVIHLSGPAGTVYSLLVVSPPDAKGIMEGLAQLDESLFREYRLLSGNDGSFRVMPDVWVPAVSAVPSGTVRVRKPDNATEEARYFPDISVVRRIDEKDAQSFTDGQRLLRITSAGVLEYRVAHAPGAAPDLGDALKAAQEWIGSRGGWPQEVVLTRYVQQPGKVTLAFDVRTEGPFPVETAEGAIELDMSTDRGVMADRIIYFRRLPPLVLSFNGNVRPIHPPEKALQTVVAKLPYLPHFEAIRDVHLAYLVRAGGKGTVSEWMIEPVWVFQFSDERVYAPAEVNSTLEPFTVRT